MRQIEECIQIIEEFVDNKINRDNNYIKIKKAIKFIRDYIDWADDEISDED